MSKEFHIAETEWKVMEALWQTPGITMGEIRTILVHTGWSDSTIKTLVRRLAQKGAVDIDDSGTQYRYYPAVSEHECKLKETKSLINRIYHGSVKMLLTNLVSGSNLTEEETRQLMEIIDKMDGGKGV